MVGGDLMGFDVAPAPSFRRTPSATSQNRSTAPGTGVRAVTAKAASGYDTTSDNTFAVEDPTGAAVHGVYKYGRAFFKGMSANAASANTEFWQEADSFPKINLTYTSFGAALQMGTGAAAATEVVARGRVRLWQGSEANPRLDFDSSVPQVGWGPGTATIDTKLYRSTGTNDKGLKFEVPSATARDGTNGIQYGLQIHALGGKSNTALDGAGGGPCNLVRLWPNTANGTNGSRTGGNSILSDAANPSGFSSFGGFDVMNGDNGTAFDDVGSIHQFKGDLTIDPYSGGGDAYCEGLNYYGDITTNRKGVFSTNIELRNSVTSGNPARVAVARLILQEANAASAYNGLNLGTSRYVDGGGAIGLEIVSQGAQRGGIGISFWGSAGWRTAVGVYTPGTTTLVSGIDGLGGVQTRTKAGAPVDGDFRNAVSGLIAVDTTNSRLYCRVGGTWKSVLLS